MSNKERINWLKRNFFTVARQVDYLFTKFLGPAVIMSGMHPMRGVEHPHCALHVNDAPKLDENSDNEVVDFIDEFITCSLPDENTEPELHKLVTSRLFHKHTFKCRKKKGVRCRFNAPWPPSKTTQIIRGENLSRDEVKKSKRVVDKVLHEITSMQYGLNDVILEDILDSCGISEEEYENAMDTMQKNTTILYKRQANEINVVPYNTVLLNLLRSNINIQFVTGSDDVNVFATNMVEKYSSRPDILKDICYADFATTYKNKNVDDTPDEDHITNYTNPVDIDVEELQVDMQTITLKNGLGKMRKRKKCVMRYHKPSKFSSSEGYYMVLLQLYMPWRNENDIIGSFGSYKEKFDDVFEDIKVMMKVMTIVEMNTQHLTLPCLILIMDLKMVLQMVKVLHALLNTILYLMTHIMQCALNLMKLNKIYSIT